MKRDISTLQQKEENKRGFRSRMATANGRQFACWLPVVPKAERD